MSSTESTTKPGCRPEPGRYVPVIDRNRCEGKGDCVRVCPYGVFRIEVLPKKDRGGLGLRGRIKGFVHSWKQAQTPGADQCHACGQCIGACPEKAVRLVPR